MFERNGNCHLKSQWDVDSDLSEVIARKPGAERGNTLPGLWGNALVKWRVVEYS